MRLGGATGAQRTGAARSSSCHSLGSARGLAQPDESEHRDVCSILEDAGLRFYEAANGDEAKQLLARLAGNVALLFSDVEMPGQTNGFALARYAAEHWPWIKIVIASGRITPEMSDMPEKANFISKPFSTETLQNHLREMSPEGESPSH